MTRSSPYGVRFACTVSLVSAPNPRPLRWPSGHICWLHACPLSPPPSDTTDGRAPANGYPLRSPPLAGARPSSVSLSPSHKKLRARVLLRAGARNQSAPTGCASPAWILAPALRARGHSANHPDPSACPVPWKILCSRRAQPPSGDKDKHCRRLGGIGAARARGGAALRWLLVVPRPPPSGAVAPQLPNRSPGQLPALPAPLGPGPLGARPSKFVSPARGLRPGPWQAGGLARGPPPRAALFASGWLAFASVAPAPFAPASHPPAPLARAARSSVSLAPARLPLLLRVAPARLPRPCPPPARPPSSRGGLRPCVCVAPTSRRFLSFFRGYAAPSARLRRWAGTPPPPFGAKR